MAEAFHPLLLLRRLNRVRWYFRWPLKWAIFGLAYAAVCFPYPHLVYRHLVHWKDPNKLIAPDSPALAPLAADLRDQLSKKDIPIDPEPAPQLLEQVESFVYRRVPYAWDWDTWGMADYLPTVEETITMGREDCDGRAVVAASLIRNLGYDARIVTDFAHVWVWTPYAELMGPGQTRTVEITDKGVRFDARGLVRIPQIMSYGIAVFPLLRELILLVVLWLLLLGRASTGQAIFCFAVVFVGLLLLRYGAANYWDPKPIYQIAGAAAIVLGTVFLLIRRRGRHGVE